jgi:hypothetical protein
MSNHQEPTTFTPPQGISGFSLEKIGFKRNGVDLPPNVQLVVAIYQRENDTVKYDGVNWFLNGSKIKSMEEIA